MRRLLGWPTGWPCSRDARRANEASDEVLALAGVACLRSGHFRGALFTLLLLKELHLLNEALVLQLPLSDVGELGPPPARQSGRVFTCKCYN